MIVAGLQESVRAAATGLIRTLRGLTLRLADPELSPQDEAAAAVSITLPFLVESGEPRSCRTQDLLCAQPCWHRGMGWKVRKSIVFDWHSPVTLWQGLRT